MFPFPQKAELAFGNPTNTTNVCLADHNIIFNDDQTVDYVFDPLILNKGTIDFSASTTTPKQEIKRQLIITNKDQKEKETRRVIHRDIERRRREEMSKLYASLRSLLPLEHKGKLSVSDHMQEVVSYTKQLQKKVQQLRIQRDKLKKVPIIIPGGRGMTKSSTSPKGRVHNSITLSPGQDGIEILIITGVSTDVRLSRVIKELHDNELNVVSYVSTKSNGTFLHKIQAEASDMSLIDISMLQERLTEVID